MTYDVVALCRSRPDLEAMVTALVAAGPDLRVVPVEKGAVIQLVDDDGRQVVAIESPSLVQVPGEAYRVLGVPTYQIDAPVWWIEARATAGYDGANDAALNAARVLVASLGGVVWPTGEVPVDEPETLT